MFRQTCYKREEIDEVETITQQFNLSTTPKIAHTGRHYNTVVQGEISQSLKIQGRVSAPLLELKHKKCQYPIPKCMGTNNTTYVLAICPLLIIGFQVPRKRGFEKRLVVGVLEINLLVTVRFPIGRDIDDGLEVWPTEDEHTADDGIVVCADHTEGTKKVFARCLEAVEEPGNEVRRHEGQRQLLRILIVDAPDGEALFVESVYCSLTTKQY